LAGARNAFLEIAGERALDWAGPRPRPASVGGAFADEQARLRRSFGFVTGTRAVAGEHSFCTGTRLARKHNDGRVALAALRKESPMTDLITAARQGNGLKVEVAPLMVVAEFRGLGQLACCCRSVASTRQRAHPGFMVAAFILASSHRVLCRSSSTMPPRLAISQKSFAV
jgi:hypothetical protein